jgi:hypothetical protein
MLATAAGSTLGALIGGALITAWLQPFGDERSPLEATAIAIPRTAGALGVWGAGIGVMQALLLWRRLVGAYWRPFATLGGWVIAGALGGALPIGGAVSGRGIDIGPLGFAAVGVVTALMIGLLSGLFQWLILRQQADHTGWWVWTTAGGIALAIRVAAVILSLVGALGWLRPEDFPSALSWGVVGLVVGLVSGATSGWALIRLPHPLAVGRAGAK